MRNKSYRNEYTRFSSSEQGKKAVKRFRQQLIVANRTEQTVRNYIRSIEGLMNFHDELPENLRWQAIEKIIKLCHGIKRENYAHAGKTIELTNETRVNYD